MSPSVGEFYVYALVDPRTNQPFYVGKGKGLRYHCHEREARIGSTSAKATRIREIWDAGRVIQYDMLAAGLDERSALRLERETIARLREVLTNKSPGGGPLSKNPEIERQRLEFYERCRRMLDGIAVPKIVAWLRSEEPLHTSDPIVRWSLKMLERAGIRFELVQ